MSTPKYVQVVLTDAHASMLSEALHAFAPEEEQQEEYAVLEHFVDTVRDNPDAFPVTGRMAASIKRRQRIAKGPAQPQSRKNRRKARQEKRQSASKRRRKERRERVEQMNAARERIEAELREMQEIAAERARRREQLASRDELPFDEVAELFELFDLPHVAKYLRDEHALTPQERLERAAKDREEYGLVSNA